MTSSGSRGRSIARCRSMPARKSTRAASRLSLTMRKSMKSTAAATPCGESFRNRSWSRPSDKAPRCGSAPDGGRRIGSRRLGPCQSVTSRQRIPSGSHTHNFPADSSYQASPIDPVAGRSLGPSITPQTLVIRGNNDVDEATVHLPLGFRVCRADGFSMA